MPLEQTEFEALLDELIIASKESTHKLANEANQLRVANLREKLVDEFLHLHNIMNDMEEDIDEANRKD